MLMLMLIRIKILYTDEHIVDKCIAEPESEGPVCTTAGC